MARRIGLRDLEALIDAGREDIEAAHDAANVLHADFWSASDDCESLSHTAMEDAIDDAIDSAHPEIPDSLEVFSWRRATLNLGRLDADRIVEDLYECLDENYNAGDDRSEPTVKVLEAARVFLAVVRSEYVPWNCDITGNVVTLDASDIAKHIREAEGR